MKHIAFFGAGNMGGALVRGACKALDPQEVLIYEPSQKAAAALSAETGCQVAASGAQAVREARYVMLCVKPQVLEPVLEGLLPAVREGAQAGELRVVASWKRWTRCSPGAGWRCRWCASCLTPPRPLARVCC